MRIVARLSERIERSAPKAHDWHYLTVPGATFAATSAVNLVARYYPQAGSSLVFPFLIWLIAAFWWGDLYSALLGAAVLSAYAVIESGFDPWRILWLVAASAIGAFLVAAVKRSLVRMIRRAESVRLAVDLADEADRTLDSLKDEYVVLSRAVQGWAAMSEADRFAFIVRHQDKFANIIQPSLGFHQLWLERKEVIKATGEEQPDV